MARIFISYKRVDKERVFKIKDQIEAALGVKCWIDLDGIESDALFMNVIIKAIQDSEVILFMYSKAHSQITDFEKDWTVRELNFASKKNKRIVFVNIDGSTLTDEFEFMYSTKQQVDATSPTALNKLNMDLRTWLHIDNERKLVQNKKIEISQNISPKTSDIKQDPLFSKMTNAIHELYNVETFDVGGVKFNMIRVRKGSFFMGENKRQVDITNDYYIGETQVTQALWQEVMGNNPSYFNKDTYPFKNNMKRNNILKLFSWLTKDEESIARENLPVENVSWNDCQEFINKLNRRTGRCFRLPTEAEWEFAAIGGQNGDHNFKYSGSNSLYEVAGPSAGAGERGTHPVKTYKPNILGIYDMSGNVQEWCQDEVDDVGELYKYMYGSHTTLRRVRGGGWNTDNTLCEITRPFGLFQDKHDYNTGLRLALSE